MQVISSVPQHNLYFEQIPIWLKSHIVSSTRKNQNHETCFKATILVEENPKRKWNDDLFTEWKNKTKVIGYLLCWIEGKMTSSALSWLFGVFYETLNFHCSCENGKGKMVSKYNTENGQTNKIVPQRKKI